MVKTRYVKAVYRYTAFWIIPRKMLYCSDQSLILNAAMSKEPFNTRGRNLLCYGKLLQAQPVNCTWLHGGCPHTFLGYPSSRITFTDRPWILPSQCLSWFMVLLPEVLVSTTFQRKNIPEIWGIRDTTSMEKKLRDTFGPGGGGF